MGIAVFVSGNGSNLEALLAAKHRSMEAFGVSVVVTDNPKCYGVVRAKKRNIPVVVADYSKYGGDRGCIEEDIISEIDIYGCDFAVLAGYKKIVTKKLIDYFSKDDCLGIINIHPADTKEYQGLKGYEYAYGLVDGVKKSWSTITVHFVDEGVDTGDIVAQVKFPILPEDSFEEVKERGLAIEHQILPRIVGELNDDVSRRFFGQWPMKM